MHLGDDELAHLVVASGGHLHEGSQFCLQKGGGIKMVKSQDFELLITMSLCMYACR